MAESVRKWWIGGAVVLVLIAFITWIGVRPEPAPSSRSSAGVVGISVDLVAPPVSARVGTPVRMDWEVRAPVGVLASHTAVHWGTTAHPGPLGVEVTPAAAGYPNTLPEYASGSYGLPRMFRSSVTFPAAGVYAFRAHAFVGTTRTNVWSPEYVILVE